MSPHPTHQALPLVRTGDSGAPWITVARPASDAHRGRSGRRSRARAGIEGARMDQARRAGALRFHGSVAVLVAVALAGLWTTGGVGEALGGAVAAAVVSTAVTVAAWFSRRD